MDLHTLSRLNRFKEISFTLIKYGFGDLLSRLDLPDKIIFTKPSKKSARSQESTWKRIRYVLTELGPTFVKFGQLLSLRTDLLPPELANELSRLQDEVQPETWEAISVQIEKNLELPVAEVFAYIEPQPLAAASLAQVHRAQLAGDKTVVAVKVQRPGIEQVIRNDLDIMAGLARQLHERVETMALYDLPGLVRELRRLLLRELDFEREARNIRLAQANFQGHSYIRFPKVFSEYSTRKVLIMELVQGTKLRHVTALPEEQRLLLAQNGLRASLKQILEDGFFHADPHPGNIFVMEDGTFTMLDWGMVGRLTPETRLKLITLLEGIVDRDSETVLDILLHFSEHEQGVDLDELHRDIMDLLDDYYSLPLAEVNIGQLLSSITTLLHQYKIRIKSDLAIMIKAMVTSEGSARLLYPQLDVVAEARPFVRRIALGKYSPRFLQRQLRKGFANVMQMQKDLPRQLSHIIGKLENDQLSIGFEHKNLDGMRLTLDRIANRLTLGIITGCMIIGSSMIITTGVRPFIFGYPALGLVGYLLAACVGIWLVIDILRRKKL
ncbi:MAG: AarF/UbiB family protein [Desulfovermiculus sp.]|nr:AarF/UbiB family protein [Desulfovermiculus sp.]